MPHTMSRMGDVLAGFHAVWGFESDSVFIRYERGIRTPRLFQALGERRIPLSAVEDVTLTPGRRGTVVLRLVPRAGADPLMEAAAGQLKEGSDPYRLVLSADRETLAEYYADEVKGLLTGSGPVDRHLVAVPEAPLHFKAADAKASFDGTSVQFRWSWTGASSAKWKAGDQSFPVAGLSGVEWRSPEVFEGHLRLLPREAGAERPAQPDQDPASVVFGLGYGPVHESLPFAAAVLAAVRTRPTSAVLVPARRDPADIAERIRHLGELHQAGLVTDEEFSSKKAELLAEL
ncbi:Short C-terminal domain-containing protein [Streptomyces sp. 1222.5]|nr:putative oligomerization/nucleic acid binding protein [Streptomyces sp. 5112.2]SEC85165.1 Short C-terminal domain-containing protein [Streptomyces sp. 1222.5]